MLASVNCNHSRVRTSNWLKAKFCKLNFKGKILHLTRWLWTPQKLSPSKFVHIQYLCVFVCVRMCMRAYTCLYIHTSVCLSVHMYRIMQIVHGGKLSRFSWISLQLWRLSSEFFLSIIRCFKLHYNRKSFPVNNEKIIQPRNFHRERFALYGIHGENLAWEKLVNLATRTPFTNVLSANYFLLYSVVARQAIHSPVFYPPIGSDYSICQYFIPTNFFCIWYMQS